MFCGQLGSLFLSSCSVRGEWQDLILLSRRPSQGRKFCMDFVRALCLLSACLAVKKCLQVWSSLSDLPATKIPCENMSDFKRSLRKTCLTENGFRIKFPCFSSLLKARILVQFHHWEKLNQMWLCIHLIQTPTTAHVKLSKLIPQGSWVPGHCQHASGAWAAIWSQCC